MRYWTADWHLNSEIVCETSHRPWKTAEEMNDALILNFRKQLSDYDNIIHVGDLIQSGKDRGTKMVGNELTYKDVIDVLNSQMTEVRSNQLFCIQGNHDSSNDVPFVCRSMKAKVGNYAVTVGHYPTWNERAEGTFESGRPYKPAIHICGHVHEHFKAAYDKKNYVLNINVGIDAHNYRLLSDADLVELIGKAFRWWKFVDSSSDKFFPEYTFAQWENDCAKQKQAEAADKKAKMMEWLKANKPEIYAAKMKKKT